MFQSDPPTTEPTDLANFRDLGDLRTASGTRTRTGQLYRSAAPVKSTLAAPFALVVDLRCASEMGERAHPLAGGITEVRPIPTISERELAWARSESGKVDVPLWYGDVVRNGTQLSQAVIACLRAEGPTLVHCAAGKDRTGLVIAALLLLAGVAEGDVAADYLITNNHTEEIQMLRALAAERPGGHDPGWDRRRCTPEGSRSARRSTRGGTPVASRTG